MGRHKKTCPSRLAQVVEHSLFQTSKGHKEGRVSGLSHNENKFSFFFSEMIPMETVKYLDTKVYKK